MHKYPTNLTDKQWQVIKNMLDPKERFRKYSLRSVFDGILYIVKTGVQWRMLPSDFAPWQTVYYYFSNPGCAPVRRWRQTPRCSWAVQGPSS